MEPQMPTSVMVLADAIAQKLEWFGAKKVSNTDLADIAQGIELAQKEAVLDDRVRRTADDLYKLSYERGFAEGIERAAKLMEDYGCTACDHFDHDASPQVIRSIRLGEYK
jgi:hypothetical protein